MDRRTTGIIATVVAVLLCGCPGLIVLFTGALFAIVSQIPGANIDMAGSSDPAAALGTGLVMLCVGVIFIAIPIVVGVLMLRNRPAAAPAPSGAAVYTQPPDEPLPPTS